MTSAEGRDRDHNRHGDVGRAMALSALGNLALPLSAFLLAPVLARSLGVEGRGQLAAATASVLLIVTLVAFGIPEATTYFVARRHGSPRDVLLRAVVLLTGAGAAGSAALFAATPALSGGDDFLADLLHLASAAIVPTTLIGGIRAVAAGQGRWSLVNAEKYVTAAVRLGGVGALALTGLLTVSNGAAAMIGAPLVGGLVYLRLSAGVRIGAAAVPPVMAKRSPTPPTYAAVTSFGLRIWIGAVAGVLVMRLDQVLIAPLAGAYQLGLYAAAVSVAEVVLIANNAVRDVTFAADARQFDDGRLQQSARLSLLVSLAMACPIALTAPLWLPRLFGEEFAAAVPVLLVLLLGAVCSVPGSVAGAGLSARGDPGMRSLSLVLGLAVNTVALLLLVPPGRPVGGALGAAVATLLALLVFSATNLVMLWRRHGVAPVGFYRLRPGDLLALQGVARRLTG